MGLLYRGGFQVTSGEMTLSTLGTGATIAAGYYLHGELDTNNLSPYDSWYSSEAYNLRRYEGFSAAVKSAFDAATGTTFTVTQSTTTGKYTISRATNFSMTWSTASDVALRNMLGFTGNKSGTNTYTSDTTPPVVVVATVSGRSNVRGPQDAQDIAEESVSDGGDAFVVARASNEQLMSWSQTMEPRTSVYASADSTLAAADRVGSWQDFFRRVSGAHPFFVNEGLTGEPDGTLHRLTARGVAFQPQRVMADFDDHWIVPFDTRYLGRMV